MISRNILLRMRKIFPIRLRDKAWAKIRSEEKYDRIIAHYVYSELKDPEALIAKASEVLAPGGFFSVNGPDVSYWYLYYRDAMKEAGIEAPFIDEQISEKESERDAFNGMVSKYFSKVETVELPSSFRYDDAQDILDRMKDIFEGQSKFFAQNGEKIKSFFAEKIAENGELVIKTYGRFLHCSL